MAIAEIRPGVSQGQDHSRLGELKNMVGVRDDVVELRRAGVTLDRENLLRVLDANQECLSKMKGYDQKARTLREITEWVRGRDEITSETILESLGVEKLQPKKGGFSLRTLFKR